jgi:alkylated DNA nucleotide flippase Atl1
MKRQRADPYLDATHLVPRGETRTFAELAALAGRPGAARAAGRAIAGCPVESPHPWHRIVASDGSLSAVPKRAKVQRKRLIAEGSLSAGEAKVAREARRPGPLAPARKAARPRSRRSPPAPDEVRARLAEIDWEAAAAALASDGIFLAPGLLGSSDCEELASTFEDDARFERTIRMAPRGYGIGTYRYWREPMPEPARSLRTEIYARLHEFASEGGALPPTLDGYWELCRSRGQGRASSILLRYGEGGVNFPHRDVYGPIAFPYQAVCLLSRRGVDFDGGDFLLHEQEPGEPPRERTFPLDAGDLAVFASKGYRSERRGRARPVEVRHGMSPVTRGQRFALGLVLHLAE